jgi:enoyl-CoA hydratase/carnithine racemase
MIEVSTRTDGVAVVTFAGEGDRGDTLAASFCEELVSVVERTARGARVVGVVLASADGSGFCAGRDLGSFEPLKLARDAAHAAKALAARFDRIGAVSKPVVAAVHGPAVGLGFELALACTATVATDDPSTTFGLPEVHLGLLPPANGLLRVASRAGLRAALDLGLSGTPVDGTSALRLGLIDEVCSRDVLIDVASALAKASTRSQAPSLDDRLRRLALENPASRRLLFTRTRAALRARTRVYSSAASKVVDVLARFGRHGFRAAADLEATAFGELVVTEASRRLVELSRAIEALDESRSPLSWMLPRAMPEALLARDISRFTNRIWEPLLDEARRIVTEGVPARVLRDAFTGWGWTSGPLDLRPNAASVVTHATPPPEELQMRLVLRLVNEALAALDDGAVRDPRDGDVGAVLGLGFPSFRGGPFRYVDAIGPEEILHRIRSYETPFGARFTPTPALIARASSGLRFY